MRTAASSFGMTIVYESEEHGRTDADGRYSYHFRAESTNYSQPVDWYSNLKQSIIGVEATN